MERVLLIIPAYNEEGNISWVIDELLQEYSQYDYVIINDGSKDSTYEICVQRGFNCVNMPVNVGLSEVFRAGIKFAIRNGYTMALQYDGDGQHNPKYIAAMIDKMEQTNADVVIGSRFVNGKKCKSLRNLGSYIIQGIIRLTTGKKISDPTSGMRLYNKSVMKLLAEEANMAPEPDTVAHLIRSGFRVEEAEVEMRERKAGTSYLNLGNSVRYMVNICTSLIFVQWFRRKKVR